MDEESLQKSERRRGSCLDVFLVTSIIFLLVTVTAGAAGGVVVVMRLQSKLQPQSPSFQLDTSNTRSRDTPDLGYKVDTRFRIFVLFSGPVYFHLSVLCTF